MVLTGLWYLSFVCWKQQRCLWDTQRINSNPIIHDLETTKISPQTYIQVEDRSCCRFLQEEFIGSDASTGLGLGLWRWRWTAAASGSWWLLQLLRRTTASGSLRLLLPSQHLYLLYVLLSVFWLGSRLLQLLLGTFLRAARPAVLLMPLFPDHSIISSSWLPARARHQWQLNNHERQPARCLSVTTPFRVCNIVMS